MNVFYSWQADTDPRIGKQFVRKALDDAVEQLAKDLNLDEAERPSVDQDTQGVLGSPPIAETIFEKIRGSEVVVADVTLTCATPAGKQLINSNVAYELGYAHGHHGHGVILKVMNTHFGPPEDLPFDLQHRRWPVQYDLATDATTEEVRSARSGLVKQFVAILKLYAEGNVPSSTVDRVPSTINAASFWDEGEKLTHLGDEWDEPHEAPIEVGFEAHQPLTYLRIWPSARLDNLSGEELSDSRQSYIQPFVGRFDIGVSRRNRFGKVSVGTTSAHQLMSITQLFKNREIWGVDYFLLREREKQGKPFIPSIAFEELAAKSFENYLQHAFDILDYPDEVGYEMGMVGVRDYHLAVQSDWDKFRGPIFEDIKVSGSVWKDQPEGVSAALLEFYEAVFDAAGERRPSNYNNFPPSVL